MRRSKFVALYSLVTDNILKFLQRTTPTTTMMWMTIGEKERLTQAVPRNGMVLDRADPRDLRGLPIIGWRW